MFKTVYNQFNERCLEKKVIPYSIKCNNWGGRHFVRLITVGARNVSHNAL